MQTQGAFTMRKIVSVFASPLLLAGLLLAVPAWADQATQALADWDAKWEQLGPEQRETVITQSCEADTQRSTREEHARLVDTLATVTATCQKLRDTAIRGGTTHQVWCELAVPRLLPQGVTLVQAEQQAATCFATSLRGTVDPAKMRRQQCCADRAKIGGNGVWQCLKAAAVALGSEEDFTENRCKAALGGPEPYGAALWCGVCADPRAFLSKLRQTPPVRRWKDD